MDLVTALGNFAARVHGTTRPWLPLTDTGIPADAMQRLMARGLAERDGSRPVYRLTTNGRDESADLEGAPGFDIDALFASAVGVADPDAPKQDLARTAVLLTPEDDLRSALRAALYGLLLRVPAERTNNNPTSGQRSGGGGANGSAPTPGPSRWEQAGPALRSEGVVMTIGPGQSKVLADCEPADLRAAAAYYRGAATEATRRASQCDALLEAMELYEAITVADLERAHPDRLKGILT